VASALWRATSDPHARQEALRNNRRRGLIAPAPTTRRAFKHFQPRNSRLVRFQILLHQLMQSFALTKSNRSATQADDTTHRNRGRQTPLTISTTESKALHDQSQTCMQRIATLCDCEEKRDQVGQQKALKIKDQELDPFARIEKQSWAIIASAGSNPPNIAFQELPLHCLVSLQEQTPYYLACNTRFNHALDALCPIPIRVELDPKSFSKVLG